MVVYHSLNVRRFDFPFDAHQCAFAFLGVQDDQFANHFLVDTHHDFRAASLFVGGHHRFEVRVFQVPDSVVKMIPDRLAAFVEVEHFNASGAHRFRKKAAKHHDKRANFHTDYFLLPGEVVKQLIHALSPSRLAGEEKE